MKSKKVAVIGGGVSGLTLGYLLLKKGHKIEIFEKEKKIGGLCRTFKTENGEKIEEYYHHFFPADVEAIGLFTEFGLSGELEWFPGKTANLCQGKFYSYNTVRDFFAWPYLGLISKIRLGFWSFRTAKDKNWQRYQKVTANKFIVQKMGSEVWQKFWGPLFAGKFGERKNEVSAVWFWARLFGRNSVRKKEGNMYAYPKRGFGILIEALRKEIKKRGGEIHEDISIREIKKQPSQYSIDDKSFDVIVSTIPFSNLSKITTVKIPKDCDYTGIITVVIESKEPLSEYYWTNVFDKKAYTVIIEHTNLIRPKKDSGKYITYLGRYISTQNELFKMSDEEKINSFLSNLKADFPEFAASVTSAKTFSDTHAQPIIPVGWKPLPNKIASDFYATSLAHTFPHDRGTAAAVREVRKIADMI